jgi:hypothetical protein
MTDEVTTISALLQRIKDTHAKFDEAIAALPEDALTALETIGDWSVRDVIAHIGGDEMWMAGQLEALRFETLPTAASCYGIELPPSPDMDWSQDGRNAWQRERLKDLSLDDVQAMARESHTRLLTVISAFRDEQLSDRLAIAMLKTTGWIRPPEHGEQAYALWEWIRGVTYKHYAEHAEAIRSLSDTRKGV